MSPPLLLPTTTVVLAAELGLPCVSSAAGCSRCAAKDASCKIGATAGPRCATAVPSTALTAAGSSCSADLAALLTLLPELSMAAVATAFGAAVAVVAAAEVAFSAMADDDDDDAAADAGKD